MRIILSLSRIFNKNIRMIEQNIRMIYLCKRLKEADMRIF